MPGVFHARLDENKFREITNNIREIKGGIKKAMAMAANDTAKKVKVRISSKIRDRVAIKKGDIDKHISMRHARYSDKYPRSTIRLKKSDRLPLRYFGARQVKKGTGYRISKEGKRGMVLGAFQGPKPGAIKASWKGNVFAREELAGPSRAMGNRSIKKKRKRGSSSATRFLARVPKLPIKKLMGPSPWGVFVLSNLMNTTLIEAKEEMEKQLIRAVRFIALKNAGKI